VIELATPHLVRRAPEPVSAVVLGTGEAPDADWLRGFRRRLGRTPVKVFVEPAFGYVSESNRNRRAIDRAILDGMKRLLAETSENNCLVWRITSAWAATCALPAASSSLAITSAFP